MSADLVHALNAEGVARFAAYLDTLRDGSPADAPRELLDEPRYTADLSVEARVESKPFASRWGLAQHLAEALALVPGDEVEENVGLWSWLSLYYFDQVCPRQRDGSRKPGSDYRHIPEFGFLHRHRHLLYGSFAVYRRHRGFAILVLSGPLHSESALYQEITSRQDLLASRGVIEALNALYLDRSRGLPKRGAQRVAAAGTIRRFVRVMQQLDLTYDIYGMSGADIVELLPTEFDAWRGQVEAKV